LTLPLAISLRHPLSAVTGQTLTFFRVVLLCGWGGQKTPILQIESHDDCARQGWNAMTRSSMRIVDRLRPLLMIYDRRVAV